MAKVRHRIFEIYENHDEAGWELMPKSSITTNVPPDTEPWSLQQFVASRIAGVTKLQFTTASPTAPDSITRFQEDLAQLANNLGANSRVLLDFTGVQEFSSAGIHALSQFHKKLQNKGSRIVLCCLDEGVRASFFA